MVGGMLCEMSKQHNNKLVTVVLVARRLQDQQQQQQQQSWNQPQQQPQQFISPAVATAAMGLVGQTLAGGNQTGQQQAMMGLAENAALDMINKQKERFFPGVENLKGSLRRYFAVDNQYVLSKIKRVLVPFVYKQWDRMEQGNHEHISYALPVNDENAPDLYLPCMSLITYVLLCAILYGTAGKFDPEVLPDVTTKCFVTQLLEVGLIRFGFYMMQANTSFLDLLAFTGYKYVGLCLNMLVGLLVGHVFGGGQRSYYVCFLWTASAASFFMMKTMDNAIPQQVVSGNGVPKRQVMVLLFAASQFATMWFVSQTRLL
mmetsp:Transcript_48311/g.72032  ORF Transcript_48311/g.72032 Transcript_48311/m.72032 type:complete len:316 (+) Transcript_48311:1918-2865(+)